MTEILITRPFRLKAGSRMGAATGVPACTFSTFVEPEEVTTVKGGVSAGACGPGATLVRLAVAAAADTPAPGDGAGKE